MIKEKIKGILEKNLALMLACFLVFVFGMPAGYLAFDRVQSLLLPLLEELKNLVAGQTSPEMVLTIFLNNYRVCVILLASGMLIIPALFIIYVNGFLVGFVTKYVLNKDLGLLFIIKGVIFHSIFELPAIFISAAIGMRIGISIFTSTQRDRTQNVKKSIAEALLMHFLVVVPLLLMAAFIEVYVSAALVR